MSKSIGEMLYNIGKIPIIIGASAAIFITVFKAISG